MRRDEFDSLVYWLPFFALIINIVVDLLEGSTNLNNFGTFIDKNEYLPQATAFILSPIFFFSSRSKKPASAITFYLATVAGSPDLYAANLFKIFGFDDTAEMEFGIAALILLLINVAVVHRKRRLKWVSG